MSLLLSPTEMSTLFDALSGWTARTLAETEMSSSISTNDTAIKQFVLRPEVPFLADSKEGPLDLENLAEHIFLLARLALVHHLHPRNSSHQILHLEEHKAVAGGLTLPLSFVFPEG